MLGKGSQLFLLLLKAGGMGWGVLGSKASGSYRPLERQLLKSLSETATAGADPYFKYLRY